MKCAKCSGEWTPLPGKSVTTCPFCSEPIQAPSLETSSDNVIKTLVKEFGEKILLESRLSSLVADKLQNKSPQMLKRIRLAINENIPKKMFELKATNEQERAMRISVMATALTDDYGTETELAYEIVNYFADAFGYKPVTVKKPTSQTQSQPAIKPISKSGIKITPKIGSNITFGNYDWRVLEAHADKALLISESIIEARKYNEQQTGVAWETCSLRKYLNGEFLQEFTKEEQGRIIKTQVANRNNQWYGTKGGSTTNDSVFLLSLEEVDKYFGDSGDYLNKRRKKRDSGKLIVASDGWVFSNSYDTGRVAKYENEACWWWLRSPGFSSYCAAYVYDDGDVNVNGSSVGDDIGGVRPALWLNL